jgi:hypothetical protein
MRRQYIVILAADEDVGGLAMRGKLLARLSRLAVAALFENQPIIRRR